MAEEISPVLLVDFENIQDLDYLKKLNREQGMTIVVTSSELKELRSICDRIVIIANGKIMGVLAPNASDAEYGLMMSGIQPAQKA